MGPDFLTLALTAVISSVTGGGWIASKVLERHKERLKDAGIIKRSAPLITKSR